MSAATDSIRFCFSIHSRASGLPVRPFVRRFLTCGLLAALALPRPAEAGAAVQSSSSSSAPSGGPWSVAVTASAKTGYDSNLLLQDFGDQAERESWINSMAAQLSVTYQPNPLLKALFSYSPEFNFHEGESTENNITHRAALNLGGKDKDLTWEWLNGVTRIDGDDLGPCFTLNGGTQAAEIPAIGGVPIRDRRDAAIYKSSFKLTRSFGRGFARPVASFYHHDFMTGQHKRDGSEPGFLGYENYIDRQDYSGGFDLGYEAWKGTWLVAGFRAGHQQQYELMGVACRYSNSYQRYLAGVEGTPAEWLKLNVLAGPDFRDYDQTPPSGYDAGKVYAYIDATASITPTKADTVNLSVKRYMQPSFTSHSVYEDIVYEISCRHQIDSRIAVGAGFKAYGAEWRPPVVRKDWIFTPSLSLSYAHNAHLSAELSYSYDRADSLIAHTDGREFSRHLLWFGLKNTF